MARTKSPARKRTAPAAAAPALLTPEQLDALRAAGIRIPSLEESQDAYVSRIGAAAVPAFIGNGNYAAANPGTTRGQIVWNTLDTRKEVTRYERLEIIRMSRAMVANNGLARVLLTLARHIGSQRPQASSPSPEWNSAAEDTFETLADSHLLCDTRRVFNFWRVQPLLEFLKLRDGEVFLILTESPGGRGRYAIYEAHRCTGSPPGEDAVENRWFDGIQLDAQGGPVSYWFIDPEDSSKGTKVSAYNVIHLAHRDGVGPHGMPALTHAILDLLDIVETRGFTKQTLKLAAMFGIVFETTADSGPLRPAFSGLQANLSPFDTTSTPSSTAAPTPLDSNLPKYEEVMDVHGGGNTIVNLPPGKKPTAIHDQRPSPDSRTFSFDLLAAVAIGIGVPPQFVYHLEKQTGPMTEQTYNQACAWIDYEQDLLRDFFLTRFWTYSLAKDDKLGLIPAERPDLWWRVTWQKPRGLRSIHAGRDGRLLLERLAAGTTTLSNILEAEGVWWEDHVDQQATEADYIVTAAKALAEKHPDVLTFSDALTFFRKLPDPQTPAPPASAPPPVD